jgi:hypothetical protein
MKKYIIVCLLISVINTVGKTQISLFNIQVDTKLYPTVNCAFTLLDTNYRVILAPDLKTDALITDSATGTILFHNYTAGMSSPKDVPIQWINKSRKDTSIIFIPGNRDPISVLISVDLTDSALATTGYGNVSTLKSMLHHIVNVLDFTRDKVAIQVVDSNVSIALEWTNSLPNINAVIDNIESYRSGTTWCYNFRKMMADTSVGLLCYGAPKNKHHVAKPYNIVIFSGSGRHDYIPNNQCLECDGSFGDVVGQVWNFPMSLIYVSNSHADYEHVAEILDTSKVFEISSTTKPSAFFGYANQYFVANQKQLMPWRATYVYTQDSIAQLQFMSLRIQTEFQRLDGAQTTDHASFIVFDTTKAINTVLLKNDKYDLNGFIHIVNPNPPLSVPLSNQEIQIAVYPNPASHYIVVPGMDNERVTINDQNGKTVMTGFANVPISIGNCAQGTYYITTSQSHFRAKIVIVK